MKILEPAGIGPGQMCAMLRVGALAKVSRDAPALAGWRRSGPLSTQAVPPQLAWRNGVSGRASSTHHAFRAVMRSSSRLPADKNFTKDSVEVKWVFGSFGGTRCSPHVTAIRWAFISA
jgi:hypothetical protein